MVFSRSSKRSGVTASKNAKLSIDWFGVTNGKCRCADSSRAFFNTELQVGITAILLFLVILPLFHPLLF